MKKSLVALAMLCSFNISAESETTTPQEAEFNQFFEDSERGWFWYEKLSEEEKAKIKNPPKPPKQQQIPEAAPQQQIEDRPLSQKWFRENFEKYRDLAIENPHNTEAMRNYLYLEKYMMDRAVTFGYERQKVIMSDPFLDGTTRRSTANFGMRSMNINASQNRQTTLNKLSEESGLLFFFRSDDSFSQDQLSPLMSLANNYNFEIKPVSIDGGNLVNTPWLDSEVTVNTGQAETLGVQKVPAIYLYVATTGQFEMVSQGLQAQTQIEKRIMFAALRGNLISDEEFEASRSSGLYQGLDGSTGVIGLPDTAPPEFIKLYKESVD